VSALVVLWVPVVPEEGRSRRRGVGGDAEEQEQMRRDFEYKIASVQAESCFSSVIIWEGEGRGRISGLRWMRGFRLWSELVGLRE